MTVDLPEPLDVIAVGAHPDDVEIACGGTLASLVRQGYRVGIVDLTDGEPTPLSPGPDVRLAEAKQAAKTLGVAVRETLDLPNRRLFDSFESRVALAKMFRRYRPRLVMGIAGKTPMASPDHWQAVQITDAAVFYSRLTKWDEEFDHLPVHTIRKQIWYPLGLQNVSLAHGGGQFVVDISETLSIKLEAIRAYQTQFPPEKQRVFRLVEGQNRYLGHAAGFEAGELFLCATTLGVTDLVQTVCPWHSVKNSSDHEKSPAEISKVRRIVAIGREFLSAGESQQLGTAAEWKESFRILVELTQVVRQI